MRGHAARAELRGNTDDQAPNSARDGVVDSFDVRVVVVGSSRDEHGLGHAAREYVGDELLHHLLERQVVLHPLLTLLRDA
jgi:hypothetical protein